MFYNSFTTDSLSNREKLGRIIYESVAGFSFQSFSLFSIILAYKNGLKSYFQSLQISNIANISKQKIITYVSR